MVQGLSADLHLPEPIALIGGEAAGKAGPNKRSSGDFSGSASAAILKQTAIFSGKARGLLGTQNDTQPSTPPAEAGARIPDVDLKPLYDFVEDGRACQARLGALTQDAADERQKLEAMARERDAALAAARGGSFWRRLRGNARWFIIGAGIGGAGVAIVRR